MANATVSQPLPGPATQTATAETIRVAARTP